MNVDKKIADLIALGVDALRTVPIPPSIAQECARRWLLDEARDAERTKAREIERAAVTTARAHNDALIRAILDAPENVERRERAEQERVEKQQADARFLAWMDDLPPFVFVMPQHDYPDVEYTVHHSEGWHGRENYGRRKMVRELWDEGNFDGAADALRAAATAPLARGAALVRSERQWWREKVDVAIEERAVELDIAWTAALLTTTVALPDGTRVEWGEATRDQHVARLDMLAKHAATELETATRHRAAIEAIDAAGVSCLNDLARAAA